MTELKKIVVEAFPVEHLPKELRALVEAGQTVRITLEQAVTHDDAPMPPYGFAKDLYASQGVDPVEFIRQLRDEWN